MRQKTTTRHQIQRMLMIQSTSTRERSNKGLGNHAVQIALLMLIRLIFVLAWLALMYDRLLIDPFLAIILVLGVLVILFGGRIRFGPVGIDHEMTGTNS